MSKDDEEEGIGFLDALAVGVLGAVGIEIAKNIWRQKREEWRERAEYLQTEEGLKERVDARHELTKAEAYAARKRFEALVEAGFTEEQAFRLMVK
jgi:hypothetical protein